MTIIETLDCIIKGQEAEQEIRKDRLTSKDKEIEKCQERIANLLKEKEEIKEEVQKEINEAELQLETLRKIKLQIQDESWSVAERS